MHDRGGTARIGQELPGCDAVLNVAVFVRELGHEPPDGGETASLEDQKVGLLPM